jgi:exosome complex component RRP41
MRDMVAAVAAGKVADTVILDVNNEEDQAGQADMPIYKKCVDVGVKGCKVVYELQKKALKDKYFGNGGD